MGESKIEWTDTTWNPVIGCARVSEGCRHCYAEQQAERIVRMSAGRGQPTPYEGLVEIGPKGARWTGEARFLPSRLVEPLRWTRPRRVFVNSMSDLFHEDVSFEEIAALQGIPSTIEGAPLQLAGTRTQIATHIGNAVPVGAARGIGERMLVALMESEFSAFSLAGGGGLEVWVEPEERAAC